MTTVACDPKATPQPPPTPSYAKGLQCSGYGRLRVAGVSEASTPPPEAPLRGMFCIHLDSATPVTVEMAARAVMELEGAAQPGAAPVGRLPGARCELPSPDLGPPEEYALYALRLPHPSRRACTKVTRPPPKKRGPTHTRYGTPANHVAARCGPETCRWAMSGSARARYAMRRETFRGSDPRPPQLAVTTQRARLQPRRTRPGCGARHRQPTPAAGPIRSWTSDRPGRCVCLRAHGKGLLSR